MLYLEQLVAAALRAAVVVAAAPGLDALRVRDLVDVAAVLEAGLRRRLRLRTVGGADLAMLFLWRRSNLLRIRRRLRDERKHADGNHCRRCTHTDANERKARPAGDLGHKSLQIVGNV